MARPCKLTLDVQRLLVAAVSLGTPLATAAAYVSIDGATVLEWIARGEGRHARPATPAFAEFAGAIKKAKAADEVRRLTRLEQAAKGGAVIYEKTITHPDGRTVREVRTTPPEWQADAWVLERSRPETWGRKAAVDMRVTIESAAARVAQELGMSPEEVLAEAQALLKELDHGA